MISLKIGAIMAAMFIAGAFVASPELRAYAANTVFSTDIVDGQVMTVDLANNAVTAAKVKDGEIKAPEIATNAVGASEIATDAVGASELQGVTKLLFGQCNPSSADKSRSVPAAASFLVNCNISGVDADDNAFVTLNYATGCFTATQAFPSTNLVSVDLRNHCSVTTAIGNSAKLSVLVYDK